MLTNKSDTIRELTNDLPNEPIDRVVTNFTRCLHDSAFEIFGKTNSSSNYTARKKKSNDAWFDENCANAKREFSTARNAFNRTRTDQSRTNFAHARTRYNHAKTKAKRKFRIKEGRRINNLATSQPREFWKNVNSSFKKKLATSETLTAEELKVHFQTVFGTVNDHAEYDADPINIQNISDDELNANFTYDELHRAVYSQQNNKSPGTDNLSSEILKASFDHISPFLLNLYNKMFNTGEYPVSWGDGIITPIFKKGNIDDAGNYRGITLINILAKIYSQLLLNRLTNWSEEYEKLSKNQFGFQKRKSVVDCVFILHSIITKVLNTGEKLYCVFIDYEKCFDKIDRSFLWHKLISENVSSKLVTAIKSMYTTVKSCVRFKSTYSSFFDSYAGLKQGDPSSPLLFMLFVNDIIGNINADLGNIFTLNEMKLFLILYADDQVVFAKSPETLQSLFLTLKLIATFGA